MKKFLVFLCAVPMIFGIMGSAFAAPLVPNETGLDLYDAVNLLLNESYTGNDEIANRQTNADEVWTNMIEYTYEPWAVIGLSAGYTNTLGIYTGVGTGGGKTDLWTGSGTGFTGDGTSAYPFPGDKQTNVVPEGGNFGFYLYSNQNNYLYSEVSLNSDGIDYMTTYALPELIGTDLYTEENGVKEHWTVKGSAYLIGWEDIVGGGDGDYNDAMVLVSKIKPVPEPATMLLLGSGLIGLAVVGRRKLRRG
jgi:hypothetical protein